MLYTYNVVDGDTFDFDVDLGFYLTHRIRVRLAKVDTPATWAAIDAGTPIDGSFANNDEFCIVKEV